MVTETASASAVDRSLPPWRTVLAVVAHPDDESFGLGALLDLFTARGSEVRVLCLTEGEASPLREGINLGQRRHDELAAASAALGVADAVVRHHPDGALPTVDRHILAGEVIDAVGAAHAEGLLVFDITGVTGHPDHAAATAAALLAAHVLHLPVLAWTIPAAVADRLNDEIAASSATRFIGRPPEEIDLTIAVDRRRQIEASSAHRSQSVPTSPLWRRLDLLGDAEHLCWLRTVG